MALSIFAVVAAAAVPLLLTGLRAATLVKLETQAKNLAQERIEKMRNLPFHVDAQNGPFVDLLDLYYTTGFSAAISFPDSSSGNFVASAPGTGGAPSGKAYHKTWDFGSVPGYPTFKQEVWTQFLTTTHTLANVPGTFDSRAVGSDQAPALLLGVTVLTTYKGPGGAKTTRTYTEISDGRGQQNLVITQSRATGLRVTATGSDGSTLVGQAAQVQIDGSVTTGSLASAQVEGASMEQLGVGRVQGALGSVVAPPNPAGSTAAGPSANGQALGTGSCGWGAFGRSTYEDLSADTSTAVPLVPSNTNADASASGAARTLAGLLRSGSGCNGWAFAFTNSLSGGSDYDPALRLKTDRPLVGIADPGGSGGLSTGVLVGAGSVNATTILSTPYFTSSKARVSTGSGSIIRILPTEFADNGLVQVTLTAPAQITCKSNAAPNASYQLQVTYQTVSGPVTLNLTANMSGTTPAAVSLPDPSTIVVDNSGGVNVPLSKYLNWTLSNAIVQGSNGVNSLNQGAVMTLSINPTLTSNPGSTMKVEIGLLSCVADDQR